MFESNLYFPNQPVITKYLEHEIEAEGDVR